MTVAQLYHQLEEALLAGLDPSSEVVIEMEDWFHTLDTAHSPTADDAEDHGYDLWFTLIPGTPADSRFTPGHVTPE